jgi:hypothetical protein
MLCDTAAARDGLLTIVNGGIDHWGPPEYPAPLNVAFAAMLETDDRDQGPEHEFAVVVVDENLSEVGRGQGAFQVQGSLGGGETAKLPFVISLGGITIPGYGDYEIQTVLDGEVIARLPLRAMAV